MKIKPLLVKTITLTFTFALILLINPLSQVAALSNWTQVNLNNFDGGNNRDTLTLEVFSGNLYAGTNNYTDGAEVWRYDGANWTQVNVNGFGDTDNDRVNDLRVYNGNLYASTYNAADGATVFRYNSGTSWTQINTDGFGDGNNDNIETMAVYNGNLFACTTNTTTGVEIWYYNGTTWTQSGSDGITPSSSGVTTCMALEVWNGNLYAGTNGTGGARVWDFNFTDGWDTVNSVGFNSDSNNSRVTSLGVYDNSLYASAFNATTGAEVWKYSGSGLSWTQSNADGFGDSGNLSATELIEFNGTLYASVHRTVNIETWQFNGTTWSEIVSVPSGAIMHTLAEYGGMLYCGTNWAAQVLRATTESDLSLDITTSYKEVNSFEITYAITVTNNGPDNTTGVTIAAPLPAGTSFISGIGTGWSCSESGGLITCNHPGILASGSSSTVDVTVYAEEEGSYPLVATVISDSTDSTPSNNLANADITVSAEELAETGNGMLPWMILGLIMLGFTAAVSVRRKKYL